MRKPVELPDPCPQCATQPWWKRADWWLLFIVSSAVTYFIVMLAICVLLVTLR